MAEAAAMIVGGLSRGKRKVRLAIDRRFLIPAFALYLRSNRLFSVDWVHDELSRFITPVGHIRHIQ